MLEDHVIANKKCTNFQTVYQRNFSGWKSGSKDEDITQAALVEYTNRQV
ncbi:hypothetical protein Hanom_Chr10g00937891 [Helianthus anomalus]